MSASAINISFLENSNSLGLEINDLSIFSGQKSILEVEHLILPCSGVVAFMGPSGCGKSSLLKAIANLEDECVSHKGNIKILCEETRNRAENQRFAMVWQQPTVFPCSLWDNLKVPLRKRGIPRSEWRQYMEQALSETGLLEELGNNWPKTHAHCISGGQQQRLCLSMGLLKDANIILLDEPTSALDPISTEKIEQIIQRLAKTKLVLLVTHSIGQAKRISEFAAMFCNENGGGVLCEFGLTDAVLHDPKNSESRKFILRETGL